jgi:hypothetical protein
MTKKEAEEKFDSGWWKNASPAEIVAFQLWERRLCLPFGEFHSALEAVLGRPVHTMEFMFSDALKKEVCERSGHAQTA